MKTKIKIQNPTLSVQHYCCYSMVKLKSSGKHKQPKAFQNHLCFHVYDVEGQQTFTVSRSVLIFHVECKLI